MPSRVVDLPDLGDFASLQRQVVAHESVKVGAVGILSEGKLHRPPMIFVESCLLRWFESHQYEVANQVSLTERSPR